MNSAVPLSSSSANPNAGAAQPRAATQKSRSAAALTALWALYVLTLRQYSHGKRWMVITALFLIPSLLAILVRATTSHVSPMALEFLLVDMFIPHAVLPLVALLYASSMIQDELEEQTITYLLIRPLPKFALYVVKLLAAITAAVALTVVFTALTYAVVYIGAASNATGVPVRMLVTIAVHSLAVVAYCCVFGLLSLVVKRSLTIGIVYIFLVEGILANLPFGLRLFTVIYYARIILYRSLFLNSAPRQSASLVANHWKLSAQTDPKLLDHPGFIACLVILLTASLVSTLLAAFIFSRREFHVKTPEGN